MHERLQYLIGYYGLTSSRFAETVGIQPSAVSHLISGRNKPGFDILTKILTRFPEINPRWLILGEEPMLQTSNDNTGTGVSVENSPLRGTNNSPRRPITTPEKPESTLTGDGSSPELSLDSRLDFVTAPKVVDATVPDIEPQETEGVVSVPGAAARPSPAQPEIVKVIIFYSDGTFDSFGAK